MYTCIHVCMYVNIHMYTYIHTYIRNYSHIYPVPPRAPFCRCLFLEEGPKQYCPCEADIPQPGCGYCNGNVREFGDAGGSLGKRCPFFLTASYPEIRLPGERAGCAHGVMQLKIAVRKKKGSRRGGVGCQGRLPFVAVAGAARNLSVVTGAFRRDVPVAAYGKGITANLRTKILGFRGFDSSKILILRGGILTSTGKS